eukprot:TRINITY_DN3288_c0_g1_i1.p2 TRINITY_DN3288_c0_g1~~TRINITY_DN3288_c0_g1_i1.p2  ORF type:complete len:76 (+),score=5.46 TRINITY_DN3288_c0_g1_i1:600-827(+)
MFRNFYVKYGAYICHMCENVCQNLLISFVFSVALFKFKKNPLQQVHCQLLEYFLFLSCFDLTAYFFIMRLFQKNS